MKNIILLLFSLAINYSINSQVIYENFHQNSGAHAGNSIKPTSDNGYIITGFCNPTGSVNGHDVLLMKIDSLGNVEWSNNYGESYSDIGRNVVETYDGGYASVGYFSNPNTSSSDIHIVRTDIDGNLLWKKDYGNGLDDVGMDLIEIPSDSGFAFVGSKENNLILYRADIYGDTLWTKVYSDSGRFQSINLTSDNGFIITGLTVGSEGERGVVIKTDSDGNEIWKTYFYGN